MQHLNLRTNTLGEITEKQKRGFNILKQESLSARSNYYEAVLNFEETSIRRILADAKDPNGRTPDYYAKTYQTRLDQLGLWKLQWLKEAEVYFDGKLLTMVNKLVEFGMLDEGMSLDTRDIDIEEGLGMEFYISAFDHNTLQRYGRAHARFVWVECYEKVSHYRFIVTFKKDPNYKTEETQEEVVVAPTNEKVELPATGRKAQVKQQLDLGHKATTIAENLGMNVGYVRKLIRDLRQEA